jgi:hypothetical protein
MLSDVAGEAAGHIAADEVLRSMYPERKQALHKLACDLKSKENVTQQSVDTLRALAAPVRKTAISDAFSRTIYLLRESPKEHGALCNLAEGLVSELRSRGWSDEAPNIAGRNAIARNPIPV